MRLITNFDKTCISCGISLDVGRRKYCSKVCMDSNRKQYTYDVDYLTTRFASAKQRAKKRSYDFNLTKEWIAETIIKPCVYCNQTGVAQLDRADTSLGYTMDNVVPACKRCNTVKSMYLTHDQMIIVAKALGWRE